MNASECLLQKVMLAAVQVTDEQLTAPLYLMRISANFLHQTCIAGLVKHLHHLLDASQSEQHLSEVLLSIENE